MDNTLIAHVGLMQVLFEMAKAIKYVARHIWVCNEIKIEVSN